VRLYSGGYGALGGRSKTEPPAVLVEHRNGRQGVYLSGTAPAVARLNPSVARAAPTGDTRKAGPYVLAADFTGRRAGSFMAISGRILEPTVSEELGFTTAFRSSIAPGITLLS
jgi:hypothetical protein